MRMQCINGLSTALTAIIMALTALTANAAPVSIDFNVGSSATHSGEPDNNHGLQLPGQVGPWNAFRVVTSSGGEQSITTAEGPTFTLNPGGGGAAFNVYDQSGSALRGDIIANNNKPSVPWALTGLTPGGVYSLIFFQRIGYAGARTTIDGVGLGETEPIEKDYDFTGVVADGSGTISGTFDAPTGTWYSWSGIQFEQTGIEVDVTPPSIASLSPTNNATNVRIDANLVITFDEPVQKGGGNIVIKESGGSVVETIDVTTGLVTVNGTAVTINPGADLAVGTGYYVEIDDGAITDRAPTPNDFGGFTGSATWSFTTDGTAPTIDALAPTNAASNVPPFVDLVITFDEPVRKGSGNIVIKEIGGGTFATIDVTSGLVTVNGAVVTINPVGDLAPFTDYYVEIDNGAIEDLSGNDFAGISGSATWSFTTGKIPTVTSIDFDSNNIVFSGEPTHTVGLTIPGQVGPWYKLSTAGSPGSPTITTPRGTFTFNTTGVAYNTFRSGGDTLRNDFFYLQSTTGPITWTLTDLTPGGTYDIICYGMYIATTYYVGAMSIVGYNGGKPVTRETSGSEGDWNFPGVVADETGTITGIFAWETGTSFAVWGAIQFDKIADPLPAGTVIFVK